ncbi:MAG: VWA domain-containing protein, partial [Pirellulales bacterium]|nr:VWA domain-containing protein [Pirellulales bacterium]
MSKPVVGLIMLAVALCWAVGLGLLTGGASSLSHLPADDGSLAKITHIRLHSRDKSAGLVVRLDVRDADDDPIEWIDTSSADFFVGETRVEPGWWQPPGQTPQRLVICVPSSVGVESDRTAEGMREAVLGVLDELDANSDTATIVVYDNDATVLQSAANPDKKFVRSAKDAMESAKGDDGYRVDAAIELAVREAAQAKKRESRTIIVIAEATDREVVPKLKEFARRTRDKGIALFVFGVGDTKAKNDLYAALAVLCGGKYAFADSMRKLERLMREQVRKINGAHHVGLDLEKAPKKDEPLLVQTQIRTPNGSLHSAVFLSAKEDVDWLIPGGRVVEEREPEPISSIEWFFVLGT